MDEARSLPLSFANKGCDSRDSKLIYQKTGLGYERDLLPTVELVLKKRKSISNASCWGFSVVGWIFPCVTYQYKRDYQAKINDRLQCFQQGGQLQYTIPFTQQHKAGCHLTVKASINIPHCPPSCVAQIWQKKCMRRELGLYYTPDIMCDLWKWDSKSRLLSVLFDLLFWCMPLPNSLWCFTLTLS